MNPTLVFASANAHKVAEISQRLSIPLLGLSDIGCLEELPETADTLEGNAAQKARYVHEKFGVNCFADDTGLEVDALGGEPGVNSAFYGGPGKDGEANIRHLLAAMDSRPDRKARFRTIIHLCLNGSEHVFEGIVEGCIAREKRGNGGFGYDAVFVPAGYSRTFAEMSVFEKNCLSHRARAIEKLAQLFRRGAL